MSNRKINAVSSVYNHRRRLISEGKGFFNAKTLHPDTQRLAIQEMKIENATKFINNKT